MFLTSRMMILNKEKANCAASTDGLAPELKTSMSRGCIHFFQSLCHQIVMRAVLVYLLERESKITEEFQFKLLNHLRRPGYYLMASF